MKIFLTGGTGFIGSHFIHQAIDVGHSVLALRRNSLSKPRIPLPIHPTWMDCQLDQVSEEDLKGFDVLVHLAAHTVNFPHDSHSTCLYWNLTAVLALFEQARLAGIRRFIVAGSCFEYGRNAEGYDFIPTFAPLNPTNSYAASKAAASIVLSQWAEEHHLSLEILRVFHTFGEGETETRLWPSLRRAALSGDDFPMTLGEQIRDFIAVEDVAATFLDRVSQSTLYGKGVQIFNVGTGKPTSVRSFAHTWWNHWHAKGNLLLGAIPYRTGEVMVYVAGEKLICINKSSQTSS